ncbi:MAG: hypothetical protein IJI40_03010 [Firmicutes bacterium]|nr:hypothetical protein [Bacillota bacterium]MBQ6535732.1 hypothetical protein [Bacillota bacterium]
MKKLISIILIVGLVLTICACGSDRGFSIEGKWKNVGDYTWGQAQAGAIVIFNGTNCNFFSPSDTYAFYKDGDNYKLDCTSMLFSDTLSFTVKIIDNDNIEIYNGKNCLEMKRVD